MRLFIVGPLLGGGGWLAVMAAHEAARPRGERAAWRAEMRSRKVPFFVAK